MGRNRLFTVGAILNHRELLQISAFLHGSGAGKVSRNPS